MDSHRIITLYKRWKEAELETDEHKELSWLLIDQLAEKVLKDLWDSQWEKEDKDQRKLSDTKREIIFKAITQKKNQLRLTSIYWFTAVCFIITLGIASSLCLKTQSVSSKNITKIKKSELVTIPPSTIPTNKIRTSRYIPTPRHLPVQNHPSAILPQESNKRSPETSRDLNF